MSDHQKDIQAEARALLNSQGMRATAQRLAVIELLHERAMPMTHEEVMGSLTPGIYDKASVWRVLSDLAGVDIVRRMDLGDRVWRYELLRPDHAVTANHPHFLCEACSTVTCLPPLEVRTLDGRVPAALLDARFQIRISGHCRNCL